MLLKSIKMKNIRSYSQEKIDFPLGSTLLAGDIGTGKSTILMAVDFALFGIRKGEMTGSDLLRHGSDHGEIELEFDIDGKSINIKRVLRRKKDAINQESGFLSVNDVRKEFTPTEMTSHVLELIGYPQEVLKKNKPIFRYTVYTPQEQMKQIIEGENRLETMRKIFDIDKYGIIKNNSSAVVSFIRAEKRNLEGRIQDLEERKEELEEKEKLKEKLSNDLVKQKKTIHEIENELLAKKNEIEKIMKVMQEFVEMKTRLESKHAEIKTKMERIEKNKKEASSIKERILTNKPILEKYTLLKKPALTLAEIKKALTEKEKEKEQLISEKSRAVTHLEGLRKIYKQGICDVCGQPVHNKEKFATSINKNEAFLEEMDNKLNDVNNRLTELKKAEIDCREYDHGLQRKADLETILADLESRLNRLHSENIETEKETNFLKEDIESLEEKLSGLDDIEKTLKKQEKDYQEMHLLYVSEERKKAIIETQIAETDKIIEKISEEIKEKEKLKEKIQMLSEMTNWLDGYFVELMDNMEKHVMIAIQKEFNEYFQEWFYILMGDTLTVKIDENFSPIIEQNDYETEYRNLSGGEKTSVALAYRLALNKVINDLVHTIKTKDLLILDEPTDGFSTDQLDRIRDVLAKLALKQVVIVSHEPKIDTYVDNVIRVYKEDHTSRVVY